MINQIKEKLLKKLNFPIKMKVKIILYTIIIIALVAIVVFSMR